VGDIHGKGDVTVGDGILFVVQFLDVDALGAEDGRCERAAAARRALSFMLIIFSVKIVICG
jgi:hypothetical protein